VVDCCCEQAGKKQAQEELAIAQRTTRQLEKALQDEQGQSLTHKMKVIRNPLCSRSTYTGKLGSLQF
jgi:hypothetical protein